MPVDDGHLPIKIAGIQKVYTHFAPVFRKRDHLQAPMHHQQQGVPHRALLQHHLTVLEILKLDDPLQLLEQRRVKPLKQLLLPDRFCVVDDDFFHERSWGQTPF